MPTVACPACGDTDELQGRQAAEGVMVECRACGHSWQRDLTPTCTLCDSTDLVAVPTATLEEAGRGEQRTPSGIRDVYRCYGCGAHNATSASPSPDPEWLAKQRSSVRLGRSDVDHDLGVARSRVRSRRIDSAFGVFAAGETVGGRWRLDELVRWSATGSLWLATAENQQVLFKLVHPRLTKEPGRRALYAAAAKVLVDIRHPHLVPLLDVKVNKQQVLIVAEGVSGSPANHRDTIGADELAGLGAGVADALATMHARQVPHLDIRPSKILRADDSRARLIDFGIGRVRAKMRTRAPNEDHLAWQAPEQIVAHEHGPPADVYSLGLTLWALGGGDLADMGVNPTAQSGYRLTHDVPALTANSDLPSHLVDAITAATRRRPELRPSAAELSRLLRTG